MDHDYKVYPFSIILPKTRAYVKGYDGESKYVYVLIEEDDLLKKYSDIWSKVSNRIKKRI